MKTNVLSFVEGAKRLRKLERYSSQWAHINEVIAFDNIKRRMQALDKKTKIG